MNAATASTQGRADLLGACSDATSLRAALDKLCAQFGKATRIEILTLAEPSRSRALCLLRLESEAQETRLMDQLGATRFGNDVLVVVDLPAVAVSHDL